MFETYIGHIDKDMDRALLKILLCSWRTSCLRHMSGVVREFFDELVYQTSSSVRCRLVRNREDSNSGWGCNDIPGNVRVH